MGLFVTASAPAAVRWAEDHHLFILGALVFAVARLVRMARRKRWSNRVKLHIAGMGTSYISVLPAFYVDNGQKLPLWGGPPRRVLGGARRAWDTAYSSCPGVASAGPDSAITFPAVSE
jgi:hypothetical protein